MTVGPSLHSEEIAGSIEAWGLRGSPCVCAGSAWVHQAPPTVQKQHACQSGLRQTPATLQEGAGGVVCMYGYMGCMGRNAVDGWINGNLCFSLEAVAVNTQTQRDP